jgi:hypothetical protein
MPDPVIPEDEKQFLLEMIDSVAQWEGLLLLRTDPDVQWDAATVARHLYITEAETAFLLAGLADRKILIENNGLYRFGPDTDALRALIDRCADLYRHYLIPVTRILHSKPNRVQAFADAFRFRKDK